MTRPLLYDLDDLAEITASFTVKHTRFFGWRVVVVTPTATHGTARIETSARTKDRAIDQAVRLALDIRQAYDDQ